MNCTTHHLFRDAIITRLRLFLGLSLALPFLLGASFSFAQDENEVVELETYEVEGFREGLAKARQDQLEANYLKDVISSDSVGKLPDNNVAEAISRLPTLFLTAEGNEGRYVSIRGVDSDLNTVTMNGQTIAASDTGGEGGRAAPLDVLSAASIASVEVIKATTPDMDGNSIGGTINIKTPSAFDHDGTYAYGSVEYGFNTQCDDCKIYSGAVNFSTIVGDKLGVVIGANYSYREYTSYLKDVQRWMDVQSYTGFDLDTYEDIPDAPFGPLAVPETLRLQSRDSTRERTGFNAELEYRANENTRLWARAYYTSYDDDNVRPELKLRARNPGDNTRWRATSATTAIAFRARSVVETEWKLQERPVRQYVFGGEHKFGDAFTLDGNINITNAKETVPRQYYFESHAECQNRRGGGLDMIPEASCATYDWTDPNNLTWTVNHSPDPGDPWPNEETDWTDPAFQPVTLFRSNVSYIEEDTWSGDVNLKWDTKLFGNNGYIKTGFKHLDRDKFVDDNAYQFERNASGAPLLFFDDLAGDGSDGTFGVDQADVTSHLERFPLGPSVYASYYGPQANLRAWLNDEATYVGSPNPFLTQFDPLNSSPEDADALFPSNTVYTFDFGGSRGNSTEDDYTLNEVINAWYLMSSIDVGEKFNITGGLRIEWTEGSISGFTRGSASDGCGNVQGGVCITPTGVFTKKYTNYLPSIHMKYQVAERLLLRASYTTNMARPDYTDLRPAGQFNYSQILLDDPETPETTLTLPSGYYSGNLEAGNGFLDPYESNNYDVSLSYDFANGMGYVSVGYFYKKIDNAIYTFTSTPTDVNSPRADAEIDGAPPNRSTVTDPLGNTENVVIVRGIPFESFDLETVNNAEAGHIEGVEFTLQRHFDFLPAPLDGFGIVANAAFMSSSVEVFERPGEVLPFFEQPNEVFNIVGYYQRGPFEARLAWRKQGDALVQVGGSTVTDVFADDLKSLDMKVSYQINDNLGIYFTAKNLANDPLRHYANYDPNYPTLADGERAGYEVYGTTYAIGVTWNFGRR